MAMLRQLSLLNGLSVESVERCHLEHSPTFTLCLACILAVSSLPALAQSPLELGIDRSNLNKASESTQQQTIEGIRSLHAKWFRDVLSVAAGKPEALDSNSSNEVQAGKAKQFENRACKRPPIVIWIMTNPLPMQETISRRSVDGQAVTED